MRTEEKKTSLLQAEQGKKKKSKSQPNYIKSTVYNRQKNHREKL